MNFTLNVWPCGHKDKQTASPGCHSALPSGHDSVGNSVAPFILLPFKETSVCESAHKAPQPHRYRTFLQSWRYKPPCSRKTSKNLFYAVLRQFDAWQRSSGSVERYFHKLVWPLIWFLILLVFSQPKLPTAVVLYSGKLHVQCMWDDWFVLLTSMLKLANHLELVWMTSTASSKAQEHILVDITRAFNGIIVHVWRD